MSQENKLLDQLNLYKNTEIYFWGASLFLEEFIRNNDISFFNIKGIIDSDTSKAGNKFMGFEIYSPLILEGKTNNTTVIYTIQKEHTRRYWEVRKTLKNINCKVNYALDIFYIKEDKDKTSNKIFLVDNENCKIEVDYIPGIEFKWWGENSIVEIGANPMPEFYNTKITCENNSKVVIGSSIYKIENFEAILTRENNQLIIGKNFSCTGPKFMLTSCTNQKISIGDDCLFSSEVVLRASDGHKIYDLDTKEIYNHPKDIKIGNHVWIGLRTIILKGVEINDNCIVAAGAMVNKKFKDKNVILAGVPAKIVKRNVDWRH